MKKSSLVLGKVYWIDGKALKTTRAQLKYIGKKIVVLWSIKTGTEIVKSLSFFLEWATEA